MRIIVLSTNVSIMTGYEDFVPVTKIDDLNLENKRKVLSMPIYN